MTCFEVKVVHGVILLSFMIHLLFHSKIHVGIRIWKELLLLTFLHTSVLVLCLLHLQPVCFFFSINVSISRNRWKYSVKKAKAVTQSCDTNNFNIRLKSVYTFHCFSETERSFQKGIIRLYLLLAFPFLVHLQCCTAEVCSPLSPEKPWTHKPNTTDNKWM